jgi:hypothetical protein
MGMIDSKDTLVVTHRWEEEAWETVEGKSSLEGRESRLGKRYKREKKNDSTWWTYEARC